MTTRILALLLIATLGIGSGHAQDIHFAQYYNVPMMINPAATGNHNGIYRIAASFRSQWWSTANPQSFIRPTYETYSGAFDAVVYSGPYNASKLGIGVNFYGDVAGQGALTIHNAMLSLAYHKATDRFARNILSFGLMGGYVQKRIFIYDLVFESQLDDFGFNSNIYNGESQHDRKPIKFIDVNAGIMWRSSPSDNFSYYGGFSLSHISRPNESFLQDEENRLEQLYLVHAGAEIAIGRYAKLAPSGLYMRQANAQEINLGAALSYGINDDFSIYGGTWYRFEDAIILHTGFKYQSIKTGVSYDINTSELKAATSTMGAFELSFVYVYGEKDNRYRYPSFCPDF